jgi:hypothetical protein
MHALMELDGLAAGLANGFLEEGRLTEQDRMSTFRAEGTNPG